MTHPIHSADAERAALCAAICAAFEADYRARYPFQFDKDSFGMYKDSETVRAFWDWKRSDRAEVQIAAAQVGANGAILALNDAGVAWPIKLRHDGLWEFVSTPSGALPSIAAGGPAETGRHAVFKHVNDEVAASMREGLAFGTPAETPKPDEFPARSGESPCIEDRDGIPAAIRMVIQSRGSYGSLCSLYRLINIWGSEQRADAITTPAATIGAGEGKDALDAARWRALLASDRIRMLGSAGLNTPMANNYAHFGMEIWTRYGSSLNDEQKQQMAEGNVVGRDWLTKYADIAIEVQRAAMRSKTSPVEAG